MSPQWQVLLGFPWDKQTDKIERTFVCKPVSKGGLGMIEKYPHVDALKIT